MMQQMMNFFQSQAKGKSATKPVTKSVKAEPMPTKKQVSNHQNKSRSGASVLPLDDDERGYGEF